MSGGLDPNLKSILESIRETVGGAPAPVEAAPAPAAAPANDGPTLKAVIAEVCEPHVKAWLDAHLAEIVQARVAAELERMLKP